MGSPLGRWLSRVLAVWPRPSRPASDRKSLDLRDEVDSLVRKPLRSWEQTLTSGLANGAGDESDPSPPARLPTARSPAEARAYASHPRSTTGRGMSLAARGTTRQPARRHRAVSASALDDLLAGRTAAQPADAKTEAGSAWLTWPSGQVILSSASRSISHLTLMSTSLGTGASGSLPAAPTAPSRTKVPPRRNSSPSPGLVGPAVRETKRMLRGLAGVSGGRWCPGEASLASAARATCSRTTPRGIRFRWWPPMISTSTQFALNWRRVGTVTAGVWRC